MRPARLPTYARADIAVDRGEGAHLGATDGKKYLDVASGLEVRTTATVEQAGTRSELVTDLSNYQTIDGFAVPFDMRQSVNGTVVARMTIAKWEMNVPMDDDLFKMPGRK